MPGKDGLFEGLRLGKIFGGALFPRLSARSPPDPPDEDEGELDQELGVGTEKSSIILLLVYSFLEKYLGLSMIEVPMRCHPFIVARSCSFDLE